MATRSDAGVNALLRDSAKNMSEQEILEAREEIYEFFGKPNWTEAKKAIMQNLLCFLIESFRYFAASNKHKLLESEIINFVNKRFHNLLRKNNKGYHEEEDKIKIV